MEVRGWLHNKNYGSGGIWKAKAEDNSLNRRKDFIKEDKKEHNNRKMKLIKLNESGKPDLSKQKV